ncbi:NitT/TauT family transport system permease protein/sulfonate transport system permease protein [Burkholderia sp. GAS332]|jgi:ABC-type nitrate/sulfonate/bicarbonate transport system permease component|uniref:ABC transporter permease n=1 Tax=Paraburkholderia TaxID=1822464 RepID=UPI00092C6F43|nr:NitT/TauT family transport system permease protein/sulfonate transport system permease protein [Burkholderia sp. GAS332]
MRALAKRTNVPGIVFLVLLAAAWEVSARLVNSQNYPGFIDVVAALVRHAGELAPALGITLVRASAGFALSLVTMLPLGICLGRMRSLASFVEPLLDLVRPLPPLAIVPVVMLFAGTGSMAKILVVFYGAAFPILINAIDATRATHPLLINVGRSIGLSRSEIMWRIDLPAALPQIVSGIRISVALSLLISVSAEMLLSTNGIGNFIVTAQQQFEIAAGLATILVIAIAALCIETLFFRIERNLLAWHHERASAGR